MSSKHGSHWVERHDIGSITVVRLKTPHLLDEDLIRGVFDLILQLVGDMGRNELVLNLEVVDFLPSMGLGKLVMLNRKVQAANGRLAICNIDASIMENLNNTRLTPLFNIYGTEEEAVESFAKKT